MNRRPADRNDFHDEILIKPLATTQPTISDRWPRQTKIIFPIFLTIVISVSLIVMIGPTLQTESRELTVRKPCANVTDLMEKFKSEYVAKQQVQVNPTPPPPPQPTIVVVSSNSTSIDQDIPSLQANFDTWVSHLLATAPRMDRKIVTQRTTCHELTAKGQTCVFEGLLCVNVSSGMHTTKPQVYIVNDTLTDDMEVPTDNWCGNRHKSGDPRYYSTRHWPIMGGTIVPQQSCMEARYRTSQSLFGKHITKTKQRIKWIPSIALIDLDYADNDHNTHLAIDLMWLLDAFLYQESLDMRPRPGYRSQRVSNDNDALLIRPGTAFYLPNALDQFERQTGRDVNKLLWSLVLRKNPRRLYPSVSDEEMFKKPDEPRWAKDLLTAFPELDNNISKNGAFHFHGSIVKEEKHDLVCTARLTAGVKTGFSTHERVCREMRTRAYETYGIERPPVVSVGQITFPRPPKKVLFLNRHVTRIIANAEQITEDLRRRLEPLGIPVEYETTQNLNSAEEWVRIFSSAGLIITPHGSQNMGMMFMQRYSTLIEIMPVGYTEHSFNLLSEPCRIWYYELPSAALKSKRERYESACGHKSPHMYSPCNEIKSEQMFVKTDDLFPLVIHGLERLGYDTGSWLNNTHKE